MGRSPDAVGALDGDARCVDDQYIGPVGSQSVVELIELGRDREAAELAQRQGATMDVLAQLDQLGPLLAGTVGGISSDQLDAPTPCEDFTVRGVLEHMVGGATAFAAAFRGDTAGEADLSDPLGSFLPALTTLAESIHGPGALEREVEAPFGTVPGETFARFVVLDGLVHGWDMATATGQAYEPSDELVAAVQAFGEQALPPLAGSDAFGHPTEAPTDATPIERLAALTGRKV
jgi:uncharacterized protein (TIGR03086 family)